MPNQLEDSNVLRTHLEAIQAGAANSEAATQKYDRLNSFLTDVRNAVPTKLKDRAFLSRLWDDNPSASLGNGTVKIDPALDNAEFVDWFAQHVALALPSTSVEAEASLITLYDELKSRLSTLCGRTPHLKLNRVLFALFPDYFTTIADVGALRYLHREMGGAKNDHPVHAHIAILHRIEELLGPVAVSDPLAKLRRSCLPWLLFQRITSEKPSENLGSENTQQSQLTPMAATLRRKGLTAMKGGFQSLLGLLPALNDGLTREEFTDLISQANPDLAPQSAGQAINVVAREFDLCSRIGDTYRLSARGINLLESQDPNELADHLLTRVLGVDHVVRAVSTGPKTRAELVILLQKVNPGWTSDFAPTSLVGWLVSLTVLVPNAAKQFQLSDLGQRWNEMITWEPEFLPKSGETIEELHDPENNVQLHTWPTLAARLKAVVGDRLSLDEALVKQLHAGLWFHPVRHFAVLTGISGSGKTQLALNYALALCGEQNSNHETVKVVPIQPGWFDPSPLLGYVNPIQQSSYRSAPFLELLIRASDNPNKPYVAVLDEMNLSHPEQYLAPILSAMETRGTIDLHQLAEGTTQIPRYIHYPTNLAIIGTVNMDETTHGLSDKVLDRAFTLEFWNINVSDFPRWQSSGLSAPLRDKAKYVLESLGACLAPVRMHFGWRTIDDVVGYLVFSTELGTTNEQALDDALYAKVLPKLRGDSSKRFEAALQAARDIMKEHGLSRCFEKLGSMQVDLAETGTARFWR